MVLTIAEARSQLQDVRQQVQQRRQQVQQTEIPALTVAQLRARTRQQQILREQQAKQLGVIKKTELAKLIPVEKELTTFESQIKVAEEARRFQNVLRKRLITGASGVLSPSDRKQINELASKNPSLREALDKTAELRFEAREAGFKNIKAFIEGRIRKGIIEAAIATPRLEEKITITELPPIKITKPREVFASPEAIARDFNRATGSTSFTLAIPIRRENGKIFAQDFNFQFEGGKIVRQRQTGEATVPEETFIAVDVRRRKKAPGFTVGILEETRSRLTGIPIVKEFKPGVFFKPGERDREFIPEAELDLRPITGRRILEADLIEEPRIIPKRVQRIGETLQEKIDFARTETLKALSPQFKKEANLQVQEATRIQNQFDNINKEIETFNKRFGDRELSESELKIATNQQEQINKKIKTFDKLIKITETTQKDRAEREDRKGLLTGTGLRRSFTLGLLSAPFDLASFTVGLTTQPKRTLIGFTVGVQELPEEFKKAPITTIGGLAGTLAGQIAISKLVAIGFRKGAVRLGVDGKLNVNFKKLNIDNALLKKFLDAQRILLKDKRGSTFGEAAQILKKKKKTKSTEIQRKQALEEFKRKFRSQKIDIIEIAFKDLIKKKGLVSSRDLQNARNFMVQAGLEKFEIANIMAEIFRRQEIQLLRQNLNDGFITRQVFNTEFQRLNNLKAQLARQLREQNILEFRKKRALKEPTAFQIELLRKKRIKFKPLGQRFAEAQATLKGQTRFQLGGQIQTLKQKAITKQLQSSLGNRFAFAQKNLQKQKQIQTQIQQQRQKLLTLQRQDTRQLTLQQQKNLQKQINQQKSKIASLQTTLQSTKQTLTQRSGFITPTLVKQAIGLRSSTILKLKPTKPFKPFKPKIPEIVKKKKKIPIKLIGALRKAKSFNTQVRRRGKWTTISRQLPLNRALKRGSTRVQNTLRASFRIVPSPKKAKKKDIPTFIPTKKIFRRPKKLSPLKSKFPTFIEKRNQRITKGTPEVKLIQQAKKSKLKSSSMIKIKRRKKK